MTRARPSRTMALAAARAPGRLLALLALTVLGLAGGTLWWSQREPPPAHGTVQTRAPRAHMDSQRSLAERCREAEVPVEPGASASEVPPAAHELPALAEDRALGKPQVPGATTPYERAPDPPPPLPLDPDEVTPDDPHDFDLPARATQKP